MGAWPLSLKKCQQAEKPREPAGICHGRRLRAATEWWQRAVQVNSAWPHGQFFRPEVLSCWGTRILVATAFGMYQSSDVPGRALLTWQALPRKDFSAAVPLCQDDVPLERCFLARARGDGHLAVWPANRSTEEILELPSRLAGWDGQRLPVVWIRGGELTPSFDLPLDQSLDVRAMHLTSSGQLWLLLGNELMAWDVLRGSSEGRHSKPQDAPKHCLQIQLGRF
eukprot:Skav228989  [mRNA]  locus=scaffold127:96884:104216:+ [translate_table: standard]